RRADRLSRLAAAPDRALACRQPFFLPTGRGSHPPGRPRRLRYAALVPAGLGDLVAFVLPASDGLPARLVRRPDPAERARRRGDGPVRVLLLRRRAAALVRLAQLAPGPRRGAHLALGARARPCLAGAPPFGARTAGRAVALAHHRAHPPDGG